MKPDWTVGQKLAAASTVMILLALLSSAVGIVAAEQVRVAITDVAQATKETEASSSQALQAASQLAGLSTDLRRLIQPKAA